MKKQEQNSTLIITSSASSQISHKDALNKCNNGKLPRWHTDTKRLPLHIGLSGFFQLWGCFMTSSVLGLPGGEEISPGAATGESQNDPRDYRKQLMTVSAPWCNWQVGNNLEWKSEIKTMMHNFPITWDLLVGVHVHMYFMFKVCTQADRGRDSQAKVGVLLGYESADWQHKSNSTAAPHQQLI